MQYKIHDVEYELKSVKVVPHPDPINAAQKRIHCVIVMEEKGSTHRTLKFTFDMTRGNMTESDIESNGVALARTALAEDKEAVLQKQANSSGYLAVEKV